jgi:hypothetical protein
MNIITKDVITKRAILYQLIGYGILLFLIVGDEVFDFPHIIFGFPATPVNWAEASIEGAYIIVLAAFSIYLTKRFLKRIRFLEGFVPICSYCHKIRDDKSWKSLEAYISDHSEALFSHGLCPECAEKHYGEFKHHH